MTQLFILGGYTKRANKGIHSIEFNSADGTFSDSQLIAELNGPTYVGLSQTRDLMFAIHKENDKGGIVAFKKDEQGQWQSLTAGYRDNGTGCHVSYREESQTVYVSNYHAGVIDVFKLGGEQLSVIQTVEHSGSSTHTNQDAPHVHFAGLNSKQNLLFVCDLGTDFVHTYRVDNEGLLTLSSEVKLEAGTGPRHLVLNDKEDYAYIIGELANTTTVASVDSEGKLTIVESQQNIPQDKVEESAGAAIRLTKDNRFLYVSTRFHNVITVYEVSEDGSRLTKIQEIDTQGEIPRDFNLDETEEYVLVAHQDTDHISVFKRSAETGKLTFENNSTLASECVCIASA
ncbi:lactonase family protein [Aerococcaceae bacterium WGS1372]